MTLDADTLRKALLGAAENIWRQYEYNWDGEGAEAPNEIAIRNGITAIKWGLALRISMGISGCLDADVLGGIAINYEDRWVCCLNNGWCEVIINHEHRLGELLK